MRPGDLVCAYGKNRILGWGEITGGYVHEQDDFGYPHRRPVAWRSTEAVGVEAMPPALRDKLRRNRTIVPLTAEEWRSIVPAAAEPPKEVVSAVDVRRILSSFLEAASLAYTRWQVAVFYTALQTKGFVSLSGISGTGKTKLAQHLATMLRVEVPELDEGSLFAALDTDVVSSNDATHDPASFSRESLSIPVTSYMVKYGMFVIPQRAYHHLHPPESGKSLTLEMEFEDQRELCLLRSRFHRSGHKVVEVLLRVSAKRWFAERFQVGDHFVLGPVLNERRELIRLTMGPEREHQAASELATSPPQIELGVEEVQSEERRRELEPNTLFLPVRPDWRDSKSLLGYHNPLTGAYEWTPFLRFLLRASHSYQSGDGLAWFVVLDEMNLAHVEYYFADLLSVLESGRDEDGWAREPLRLVFPADPAADDLPPPGLRLPPNLYLVGTVNIDETTHAFSPKVLDRAFTLDLTEVDFRSYPPTPVEPAWEIDDAERRGLLVAFSRGGRFARIDKKEIAAHVASHPEVRDRLQRLNERLRPHQLHFGYRVFDEIVAFLAAAEENGLFTGANDLAPFDAAVLMKVLPKFHGSRGKLEAPLLSVLGWCIDPDAPVPPDIAALLSGATDADATDALLVMLPYRCPATAERARRMLWALYTDGFAAF